MSQISTPYIYAHCIWRYNTIRYCVHLFCVEAPLWWAQVLRFIHTASLTILGSLQALSFGAWRRGVERGSTKRNVKQMFCPDGAHTTAQTRPASLSEI